MPIDSLEAVDYDCAHLLILGPISVILQPILTIFAGAIAEQGLVLS